jgi:RimJ/RimL family protein N-acetyltransferase
MIVEFYQLDRGSGPPALPLEKDLRVTCWQPQADGLPRGTARRPVNYLWWALARMGGFSRAGFTEFRVQHGGEIVQRLIVTPRWYRFPFMGANDLQVGDVWTSPGHRRRQLARIALTEAHRRLATDPATIWYVVDSGNEASAALARSCGYRHVATGRRTRRLGTSLLGQYVIDRFV